MTDLPKQMSEWCRAMKEAHNVQGSCKIVVRVLTDEQAAEMGGDYVACDSMVIVPILHTEDGKALAGVFGVELGSNKSNPVDTHAISPSCDMLSAARAILDHDMQTCVHCSKVMSLLRFIVFGCVNAGYAFMKAMEGMARKIYYSMALFGAIGASPQPPIIVTTQQLKDMIQSQKIVDPTQEGPIPTVDMDIIKKLIDKFRDHHNDVGPMEYPN